METESNRYINPKNFDIVCRTCFSKQKLWPIFTLKHNGSSVLDFLYDCTSVHVEKDDALPKNLCLPCLDEIMRIHHFRKKCIDKQILVMYGIAQLAKDNSEVLTSQCDSDSETENNTLSAQYSISEEDFAKPCRTCLTDEDVKSIFSLKYKELSIALLLNLCAGLTVNKNDGLPQNLCPACLAELIQTYHFREKCFHNDILLRRSLIMQELRDKTTDKCVSSSEANKEEETVPEESNTRKRKHVCKYCELAFTRAVSLKSHEDQKHTKEAKLMKLQEESCDICEMYEISFTYTQPE